MSEGTPQDGSAAGFMSLAIVEARLGLGRTHPNPAVGAVVVRDGKVVGRGHTLPSGGPHAEVEALRESGSAAAGADMYVTLEPHNHFSRTPPCTEAIIRAGIRRIFVGAIDPNPAVSGKGIARLRAASIEVEVGLREAECRDLIRGFAKHVTSGRPLVVLKAAATLDGKLATRTGDSKWVTGPAARQLVHLWRDELDAVLVGANTLRADDPLLTTRLDTPIEGRAPRTATRIVLGGGRELPLDARLFNAVDGPVLVAVPEAAAKGLASLRERGVDVLPLPSQDGRVDLAALLVALGARGLTSLMVEGGAAVHAAFLRAGLADEVRLFLAPRISGGDGLSWVGSLGVSQMDRAWRLEQVAVRQVDGDLLVTGTPIAGG